MVRKYSFNTTTTTTTLLLLLLHEIYLHGYPNVKIVSYFKAQYPQNADLSKFLKTHGDECSESENEYQTL